MEKAVLGHASDAFLLLSRCFHYPQQPAITYLRQDILDELALHLQYLPSSQRLKDSLEKLRHATWSYLSSASLEDFQVEYTGLFIYAAKGRVCYPYESMQLERNKRLIGDSTIAVKQTYSRYGLRVSPRFADLPDHLAAELEFMHFLCRNTARTYADQNADNFLKQHLSKWVPCLVTCLSETDSTFYRPLTEFTSDFISEAANWHLTLAKEAQRRIKKGLAYDTATLEILEPYDVSTESEVRWVYTTTSERDLYSPVRVKVVNGRVEKITGREDIPYYDGRQNVRALASIAKLYAPDKLKFPLRRVGRRGEGKFKRISWDEALNEIAAVFKKYRDEGRSREVAFLRTHPPLEYMFNHFTRNYGTPNDIHTSTTSCYADGRVANVLTGGEQVCYDLGKDDFANARYTLFAGHNLLNGVGQIPRAARFAEGIRRGMKYVFVDPRLNEGSYAHGAEWVPIRPGTDAAFLMGIINVLIRDNLYDAEFLLEKTNAPILIRPDRYPLKDSDGHYLVWDMVIDGICTLGEARQPALKGTFNIRTAEFTGTCKTAFQCLMERSAEYAPEDAERISGVPAEKIKEMAHDMGAARPSVCIYSQHSVSAQYSNSLQMRRARNVLMCLLGVFDRPGGKYYGPTGPNGIKLNDPANFRIPILVHDMKPDRVDWDPKVHSIIFTKMALYPTGAVQNVLKAINTGEPYPIRVLFIIGSDLLASHSSEWRKALGQVDFIVKSHVWPDDDTDYADIVLPEVAFLERDDGFVQIDTYVPGQESKEFSFLSVIQKVVEPQFEERSWTDYVREIASRIGFGEYYDFTLDEYWDFQLAPNGVNYAYLREHGVYYATPIVTRNLEYGKKKSWETDTGRLNLYASDAVPLWQQEGHKPQYDPLPLYHAIKPQPQSANEFYLISGKCPYFWCNFFRNNVMLLEKYLEGATDNTRLWLNAKRAADLGIKDNDWVRVESPITGWQGRVRVKVTEGIHPEAVWHTYGSGHRARLMDPSSRAKEGLNVQDFVPEHSVPWTAGQAHCEAIIRLYKDGD
jgi:thiosulfate reductase/polysulfide reductase chain A